MRIAATMVVVTALVAAALVGSFVWEAFLIRPGPNAPEVTFVVDPGSSVKTIARDLKEAGLVTSPVVFELYVRLTGKSDDLRAGTFSLKTGMSFAVVVDELVRGEAPEIEMTIPEGYTIKQIGEAVRAAFPLISEEEWGAAVGISSSFETHPFVMGAAKPDSLDLEGYLFPDTYRFFTEATAEEVAGKLIDTMEEKFPMEHESALTNHQILTLASIIEREVREVEDMKLIADIFLKRLEAGMPLQADSTINYVTGGVDPSVSAEDLQIDSPYNTYKNVGLPPGPISNPGLNAIMAVLEPTPNEWYYFLTTPEGDVVYARTFNEHVANKAKYLR